MGNFFIFGDKLWKCGELLWICKRFLCVRCGFVDKLWVKRVVVRELTRKQFEELAKQWPRPWRVAMRTPAVWWVAAVLGFASWMLYETHAFWRMPFSIGTIEIIESFLYPALSVLLMLELSTRLSKRAYHEQEQAFVKQQILPALDTLPMEEVALESVRLVQEYAPDYGLVEVAIREGGMGKAATKQVNAHLHRTLRAGQAPFMRYTDFLFRVYGRRKIRFYVFHIHIPPSYPLQ